MNPKAKILRDAMALEKDTDGKWSEWPITLKTEACTNSTLLRGGANNMVTHSYLYLHGVEYMREPCTANIAFRNVWLKHRTIDRLVVVPTLRTKSVLHIVESLRDSRRGQFHFV